MKITFALAFALLAPCIAQATSEYIKLVSTNGSVATLEIADNQKVEVMEAAEPSFFPDSVRFVQYELGDTGISMPLRDANSLGFAQVVDGPGTIWVQSKAGSEAWAVIRVETFSGSLIPGGSIVFPNDQRGAIIIKLECSTDMVNWVDAPPGLYDTDSSNRFFRIRGLRQ